MVKIVSAAIILAIQFSVLTSGRPLENGFKIDGLTSYGKSEPIVNLEWKDNLQNRTNKVKDQLSSHRPKMGDFNERQRKGTVDIQELSKVVAAVLNLIRFVITCCCCCGCCHGGYKLKKVCDKRKKDDQSIYAA